MNSAGTKQSGICKTPVNWFKCQHLCSASCDFKSEHRRTVVPNLFGSWPIKVKLVTWVYPLWKVQQVVILLVGTIFRVPRRVCLPKTGRCNGRHSRFHSKLERVEWEIRLIDVFVALERPFKLVCLRRMIAIMSDIITAVKMWCRAAELCI